MSYTIIDLIEKLINIEEKSIEIYKKIQETMEINKDKTTSIIVKAIKKEEMKHIGYFKIIKEQCKNTINEEIDFYLYDKVSKLLFEFRDKTYVPKIDNVQQLIKYAFEFEKSNIALLIDIKGRLIQKEDDVNTEIYKVLSKIIEEENKHKKMFESLIIK